MIFVYDETKEVSLQLLRGFHWSLFEKMDFIVRTSVGHVSAVVIPSCLQELYERHFKQMFEGDVVFCFEFVIVCAKLLQ